MNLTRKAILCRLHYAIPYDWRYDRWYYRMGWIRFLWRRFRIECGGKAECRDCGVVCERGMFASMCEKCQNEDDKRFEYRDG